MIMVRFFLRMAVALFITSAAYLCDAARFSVGGKKVEYFRNVALSPGSTEYDRAVIVIHGFGRDASDYYDSVREAQTVFPGVGDTTLVLAPRFQTIDDGPEDDELYWSVGGWIYGRESLDGQAFSSFAVADDLLERISSNFPKVTEIVLAGHGAGAQFIQRYSGVGAVLDIRCDIKVRYVVSNPGSYMFPTPTRPRDIFDCDSSNIVDHIPNIPTNGTEYTFGHTGVDACPLGNTNITDPVTCADAAASVGIVYDPRTTDLENGETGLCVIKNVGNTNLRITMTSNHGSSAAWMCERLYDKYRYGVSDLPNGLNYTSLSIAEVQTNLVNRDVFLLLGTGDISRDVSPKPDRSCEADTQGLNRYERGRNYRDGIKAFDCSARTTITTVVGVGHDHHEMFMSPQGIMLLFIG